jgi:hypothetical protein
MDDNSIIARRQLLLGALEKYVRQGNFELFQAAEWVLVQIATPGGERIDDAQALMDPADVARWNEARNAMFQHVVSHLEISTS